MFHGDREAVIVVAAREAVRVLGVMIRNVGRAELDAVNAGRVVGDLLLVAADDPAVRSQAHLAVARAARDAGPAGIAAIADADILVAVVHQRRRMVLGAEHDSGRRSRWTVSCDSSMVSPAVLPSSSTLTEKAQAVVGFQLAPEEDFTVRPLADAAFPLRRSAESAAVGHADPLLHVAANANRLSCQAAEGRTGNHRTRKGKRSSCHQRFSSHAP